MAILLGVFGKLPGAQRPVPAQCPPGGARSVPARGPPGVRPVPARCLFSFPDLSFPVFSCSVLSFPTISFSLCSFPFTFLLHSFHTAPPLIGRIPCFTEGLGDLWGGHFGGCSLMASKPWIQERRFRSRVWVSFFARRQHWGVLRLTHFCSVWF